MIDRSLIALLILVALMAVQFVHPLAPVVIAAYFVGRWDK